MPEKYVFGQSVSIDVTRMKNGKLLKVNQDVAAEVPCTIIANDVEIGTLLCSPSYLNELAAGFLFSSGFIRSADDFISSTVDSNNWVVFCRIRNTPSPEMMEKRIYTPGCGKGVMYYSLSEMGDRVPVENRTVIKGAQIGELANWLQHCSELYRETGGFHTAGLSIGGLLPEGHIDDIGRHNAVDKVIGKALLEGIDFSNSVLISSGRTSSEILHKARNAGIVITIARGAPTHQTVLRAREIGITVIGFARGWDFTVYAHEERIKL